MDRQLSACRRTPRTRRKERKQQEECRKKKPTRGGSYISERGKPESAGNFARSWTGQQARVSEEGRSIHLELKEKSERGVGQGQRNRIKDLIRRQPTEGEKRDLAGDGPKMLPAQNSGDLRRVIAKEQRKKASGGTRVRSRLVYREKGCHGGAILDGRPTVWEKKGINLFHVEIK